MLMTPDCKLRILNSNLDDVTPVSEYKFRFPRLLQIYFKIFVLLITSKFYKFISLQFAKLFMFANKKVHNITTTTTTTIIK